jgi:hypothetical protein
MSLGTVCHLTLPTEWLYVSVNRTGSELFLATQNVAW